ncbi:MAG: ABC transporter ATP-binding protein [Chloroflexi bacterium]|jgi:branched-chain amino acid transport system ATP-binding protein|nr:ABC transporter ATP-binding protein [Chloroflexota bacterium]MBT4754796.1 ABC transporter ATP-binding protein [Chloroflexota bacterium]MBT5335943.1 ABC transporter ATP-binding protein [Chloroflexota bacterium]MBT6358362.1 ABC transporter ATP-binding protein [Chloroflexota bacterium]MBT6989905.1 ABC transporter ATP-binding protein [Chloroflexota bacterium]
MPILQIEEVTAGYGVGPDILKGLSLNLEKGKSYCIIGPNGAGKSTLLKIICGLLHPRTGKVIFNGEDISNLRTDEILHRGICFVPQDFSLFPDMTVKENLRMGGYIIQDRDLVETRIEEVIEMFPILGEKSSDLAKTLSGGQQQMLAIGRSLILKPEVIMLDEPSLGLAPNIIQVIFDSIEKLRESGMTIVMVEQNAHKGLDFAEWGCVLDLGIARFEGPSDTILNDPRIQELYLGKIQRVAK